MQLSIFLQVLVLGVALVHITTAFQSLFVKKSLFAARPKVAISKIAAATEGGVVAATNLEARQAPSDPAIFVGNCPFDLQESQVEQILQDRIGRSAYKSISYIKNKTTGEFRGFCYINFNSQSDAETAVEQLKGLKFNDRDLKVDLKAAQPLKPRRERTPRNGDGEGSVRAPKVFFDHSIYVGNLDYSTSKQEIMNLCVETLGDGVAKMVRMSTDRETGEFVAQQQYM